MANNVILNEDCIARQQSQGQVTHQQKTADMFEMAHSIMQSAQSRAALSAHAIAEHE